MTLYFFVTNLSPALQALANYSLDQVQILNDHARRESVKKYASVQLDEKRRLLEEKSLILLQSGKTIMFKFL